MPTLYGASQSPFVRKVKVALAEKGIAYEQDPVIPFGVSDEYRRKSPLGKIPCWEEDGFALPDSSCILAYLERTHPEPRLYPEDPRDFGRALFCEEYADTKLAETLGAFFFERYVRKNLMKQEADEERLAKLMAEQVPPVFDWLEAQVEGREVLVGRHFSVADIAMASPFVNWAWAGERVDASRWPALAAYVKRIHARPSFEEVLEAEGAPPTS